ncbi:hypothetical protein BDR04DRAFT_1164847 [Suillus decipiens]|nr:hypothetical protein BDR04DRAFT_1164847 [Suillus decipiens]
MSLQYSPTSLSFSPASPHCSPAYCEILCPAPNLTITDLFLTPASPAYSLTSPAFESSTEWLQSLIQHITMLGTPSFYQVSELQTAIVMPHNYRSRADDREDFEAEINAVTSDESDGSDGSDSEQSGSDLDQLRLVLTVPGPNAQMHEVQKVSTLTMLVLEYVI